MKNKEDNGNEEENYNIKKIHVRPELEDTAKAITFFEEMLTDAGAPMKVVAQSGIAVDEIFSNIARYSGADAVELACKMEPNRVTMRFCDNGKFYNPLETPDPDVTLGIDERKVGGLGIFMVKKTMDDISYRHEDGCNILVLQKSW